MGDAENYKFAIIVACFLSAVLMYRKREGLLKNALFLTLAADFFMLFTARLFIGVLLFCGVQIIYFFRYTNGGKKSFKFIYFLYIIPAVAAFYFFRDMLAAVSAFYACCLVTSVISAFLVKKNRAIISTAMFLFLLCDICVLFANLPDYFPKNAVLDRIANVSEGFVWLFYAPSQVLLALSGRNFYLLRNK